MSVTLVQMPYVAVERPSVALGTLSACLKADGIATHTLYANLLFAEQVGLAVYERVNHSDITLQIGEWTFAEAAFGSEAPPAASYVDTLLPCVGGWPGFEVEVSALRVEAERLIERVAAQIVATAPSIVGCSSVFQQQCASLALLRRIRELDPSIVTMLGGANCEGSMGAVTHKNFEWVDFVVSGEADLLLPHLCRMILGDGPDIPIAHVPDGVHAPVHRNYIQESERTNARLVVDELDVLPVPCYEDYFAQLERSPLRESIIPCIPFESSRGCWWGQKHHCTFCGLNGAGMTFRSKSQKRVVEEISALRQRHNVGRFMGVDNILDNRYFAKALPAFEELGDLSVFYETKANLSRRQVEQLSDAGVRWIQPGIEALHDDLLNLLKKGTTVCMNVQLLKWARTYGIWVIWNHLHGAPGERKEWYDEVADWLPLIAHLQSPAGAGITGIRYDRFSPYFNTAKDYGLQLQPYWAYGQVYPLAPVDLAQQAYFFIDESAPASYPERLHAAIEEWGRNWMNTGSRGLPEMNPAAPNLSMIDDGECIYLQDTRQCAVRANLKLTGIDADVYRACDSSKTRESLQRVIGQTYLSYDKSCIDQAIERLLGLKIMVRFGERLLSLATDEPNRTYHGFENFPGGLALTAGRRPKNKDIPEYEVLPGDVPLHQLFSSDERAGLTGTDVVSSNQSQGEMLK